MSAREEPLRPTGLAVSHQLKRGGAFSHPFLFLPHTCVRVCVCVHMCVSRLTAASRSSFHPFPFVTRPASVGNLESAGEL